MTSLSATPEVRALTIIDMANTGVTTAIPANDMNSFVVTAFMVLSSAFRLSAMHTMPRDADTLYKDRASDTISSEPHHLRAVFDFCLYDL